MNANKKAKSVLAALLAGMMVFASACNQGTTNSPQEILPRRKNLVSRNPLRGLPKRATSSFGIWPGAARTPMFPLWKKCSLPLTANLPTSWMGKSNM